MMDYHVVASFNEQHQLASAKALLESEGINCQIKDELASQVYTLTANAFGGIKLLVHKSELERANTILLGSSFITNTPYKNDFLEKFAKKTNAIQLLGSFKTELRLLVLAAMFFGILVFGIVILMSK